ncbi:RNA polymerase sigma factor [Ulvibacterium marinum]|uniref:Sigma-70 family RNA polymerase sigma factor n=1 Tax=Ulvibacterium marinum TaxID=2419782 RepID=A0A3B0CDQ7_9FLAO|nr:sigma-70 family RNA polymerase sigma factor [Ulvibacterium marinum]RKN83460.1 sigma-70 family RNA polymerase sigma factor [Ulvibacterium marinum]
MQDTNQKPPVHLDALIAAFQKKDIAAFEHLYQMYAESMCGAIHYIVKNEKDAQDICQEVFMKIWDNAETYDHSKGRFFTWILSIARNAAIDRIRSKAYKNRKQTISSHTLHNYADHRAYQVESKLDTQGMESLMKSLSEKCRQTIILFYLKGYTQKEVSEELRIPLGTVKTRNRSALLKLRRAVEGRVLTINNLTVD